MKSRPGSYALVLESPSRATTRVGRWGRLELGVGYYVYVGSAFGPGGVRARVSRHLREEKRSHWHIDYLRGLVSPVGVWLSYDDRRLEHEWARVLAGAPGMASVEKFGCSDCDCESHLFYAPRRSALAAIPGIAARTEWLSC